MNYSVSTNISVFRENYDFIREMAPYDIFLLVICSLGLPGNLLVIAVYILNMKTSTRVYMFALAIADLVVCVCGAVISVDAIFPRYFIILQCLLWASVYFQRFS